MTQPDITLPTGETLPGYDEGPADGVDIDTVWDWLIQHRPNGWRNTIGRDGSTIRAVLAALQAVGDATLVKNGTYRAMRRDGADVERLGAWFANHGMSRMLVQHDGDAVSTAVTALAIAQQAAIAAKKLGIV